jgi:hypothetical protein
MIDPGETAGVYREGFCEGVSAVVKGLGDALSEDQRRVLEKWLDGPLAAWRRAGHDAPRPPMPLLDGA